VLDEVAGAQGRDLLLVERGLVAEIERIQAFDKGEAGEMGAHGDVLGRFGGHLLGEDVLESRRRREQAEALQVLLETIELGGRHGATPARAGDSAVVAALGNRSAPSGPRVGRGAAMSVFPRSAS
jgi:hypothetical protein